MSGTGGEAARDYSRESEHRPGRGPSIRLWRGAFAVLALAGAAALVAASFATVIEIRVGEETRVADASLDLVLSGFDRHGPALIVLAAFAVVMLLGGLSGARPAMAAVAVAGITVLGIALLRDAPDIHDTGEVGELYEATASPESGYYLETLGGALLLLAGGGLLVVGGRRAPAAHETDELRN